MSSVTMKLLIHKTAGKVVYAEAGKEFVDFLIHALVQPVGPTMKKLHSNDVILVGSLGNIYNSVEDFDPNLLLHADSTKHLLLNPSAAAATSSTPLPVTSHVPLLLPKEITVPLTWPNPEALLYTCSTRTSNLHQSRKLGVGDGVFDFSWSVSDVEGKLCSICGNDKHEAVTLAYVEMQGYVKANVPYMVSDDLLVKPLSSDAVFMVLNKLSGEDMSCLEERVVTRDTDKGMELIKASLTSKTVLTDIFLVKKE